MIQLDQEGNMLCKVPRLKAYQCAIHIKPLDLLVKSLIFQLLFHALESTKRMYIAATKHNVPRKNIGN